ncbi:hypothetical protein FHS89_001546 [Rubricella aquisinus]|uniref:YHYH domain-containing protein n=1 Tax=Rubricella aquisinus TaxID=2028108 RepID=A0A840WYR1_9RHOB|nr:YHYH protein [Rubricella aquisinus]MBB5515534.1 hypothetical protein [Rubricella aquisinus]
MKNSGIYASLSLALGLALSACGPGAVAQQGSDLAMMERPIGPRGTGQRPAGPPSRVHTATEAQAVTLVSATRGAGDPQVTITQLGDEITIRSNGIPEHEVGQFPNAGNPNSIRAQAYSFTVDATPVVTAGVTPYRGLFGVAINGVPFEPGTAEVWQGDRSSGWNYDALGGAIALGLDANYAHVQPTGAYHYHGLPIGLMQDEGWTQSSHSPLLGYAADGFPIYALTGVVEGEVRMVTSSYALKSGERPGGSQPTGVYDGTFVQDWEYVAGLGSLDQCNGMMTTSADYPGGTYAYFLTDTYPYIPRCLVGDADPSFSRR